MMTSLSAVHLLQVPGKSAFNMMGIEFMTSKEAWACGGEQHPLSTKPLFLYTNDAGK